MGSVRAFLGSSAALLSIGAVMACSPGGGTDGEGGGEDGDGQGASASTASEGTGNGGPGGTNNAASSSTGIGVECSGNADCDPGEICDPGGSCVPGCANDAPCPMGISCCNGTCIDTSVDLDHCGGCDSPCDTAPNVPSTCVGGICGYGTCDPSYSDCDGDLSNGCETIGMCLCTPGATQPCYDGAPNTENVGTCIGGIETCNPNGLGWGTCIGQVLPVTEVCADGLDNDCNGAPDDIPDLDGDGWTLCDGDCCDEPGSGCADPDLVNPGAFEYPGNMVDDDCDPATPDTPAPGCSTVEKLSGVTPLDVIQAMDLCQTTTQNPPLPQMKWGVITTEFRLANGNAPNATQLSNMQSYQAAVMTQYGNANNVPQLGATFAGISSGRMRDVGDAGYVAPNGGSDLGSSSTPPAAYLAQHGNQLPSSASCYGNCPAGSGAYDSINVRASIRVPTNAQSFSYKFRFFSSEFWTWSCTAYNDFYLALLTSAAVGIPLDKNISFDSANNPVSVNNGFFDVCQVRGCQTCPAGSAALTGTGMENLASHGTYGIGMTGGATNWLTTTAPVVPGETITIEFMVFDVSDNVLDSLTLLDAFVWSVTPSGVGTEE
jgi:hypothetical protein